jgi:RNA polymerase subunit RPABC4/transcription elongation factor Spt4
MVGSGVAALTLSAPAARSSAAPAAAAPAIVTHGDLVVGAGVVFPLGTLVGHSLYYQGGNITVLSGGTLIVRNVVLSFVQFIGSTGTASIRLSHIYHFTVASGGIVDIYNSTITTDVLSINAYAKLNITINGTMSAWNSSFQFPGWVTVGGSHSNLTLNDSQVMPNPEITQVAEPALIQGDTGFAATLSAVAGGSLNLFNSSVSTMYADDQATNGTPGPAPLSAGITTVGPGTNITTLATPSDSANLTRDWLYPMGITSGAVRIYYNDSSLSPSSGSVTVWFGGTAYPLPGTAQFTNGTVDGIATVPFSAALIHAINRAGMLKYLNDTGDFGAGPSVISIQFPVVGWSGPVVTMASTAAFDLNPPVSYDLPVSGAGSRLSTVDTTIGLTFAPLPVSPISLVAPYPWLSNKVNLTGGATAFLGNLTVSSPLNETFESSAILTDATSQAFLYRWAAFNLTGLGGVLEVTDGYGSINASYAYSAAQLLNGTTNAANALSTADPEIWSYLFYYDHIHGFPAYGKSGSTGQVRELLASNQITGSSNPDGWYLGDYHIVLRVNVPSNNLDAFNWSSMSPYPVGVAVGTPGYGLPDYGPSANFPSYYTGLTVESVVILANGTAAVGGDVRLGQQLGFNITVKDTGTAPITELGGTIFYNANRTHVVGIPLEHAVDLTIGNPTDTFAANWTMTDAVTGLQGTFMNEFAVQTEWNLDLRTLGGGLAVNDSTVTIEPSLVALHAVTTSATPTLNPTARYVSSGTVFFNGTFDAIVEVIALPTGGGSQVVLVSGFYAANSTFNLDWSPTNGAGTLLLSPGASYTLEVTASYNSYRTTYVYAGTYSVPAVSTPAKNLLTEKFFGLPLWMWLAIAAGVVAAILVALFVARRQAAGKLVECGECGNLIPESATVCPKCGAEFESDLVRCSRCASTIPANSKFCPECAAQLLGKPGEEALDPERQGYADFTERFRAEAKKELGDNYNEGSFWDWWRRQPSYVSFSQWKLQQGQGTARTGMGAPPPASPPAQPPRRPPPKGGAGGAPPPAAASAPGDRMAGPRRPAAAPAAASAPPQQWSEPAATGAAPAAAAATNLKPCPNCGKEIPPEYLVCPFCGSVTQ